MGDIPICYLLKSGLAFILMVLYELLINKLSVPPVLCVMILSDVLLYKSQAGENVTKKKILNYKKY